jgi:ribosome-binding protein aMBF1 (putative translation factor)
MTERYTRAAHAVQTAIEFNPDKSGQSPKHLRVGIDMSKADLKGLVELLIEKGLITVEEYVAAIEKSAEAEADMHRMELADKLGMDPDTINLY